MTSTNGPTYQQLYGALQRADAAGDTEAAKAIARAIVSGAQDIHQQALASAGFDAQGNLKDHANGLGTDMENFKAAMGAGFEGIGLGLAQYASDPINMLGPAGMVYGSARDMGRMLGLVDKPSGAIQDTIDEHRREDAPLMRTKAGLGGVVGANLAAMLATGGALKYGGAGAAGDALLAPSSAKMAALVGGAQGALQPVASTDSLGRTGNVALGAAVGPLAYAIPKGVGAVAGAIGNTLRAPTAAASDRRAAETILAFMENPQAAQSIEQSSVPGVARTSAEAINDNGLYQLERAVASRDPQFAGALASQRTANNAARLEAIQQIAGDASKMDAATAARQAAAMPLLEKALATDGVNTKPVVALIDRLLTSPSGKRDAVASALSSVKAKLVEGDTNVGALYGIRQHIGDLMSGKLGGDQAATKLARKELIQVRGMLDNQISEVAPEFGQYLRTYADKSLPVSQMQIGQRILSSSTSALEDQLGNPVLSPAKFAQQLKNADRTARTATGFRQARFQDVMSPDQTKTLGAVGDDLARQNLAMTAARPPGSPTAQLQHGQTILDAVFGPLGLPEGVSSLPVFSRLNGALSFVGRFFKSDPERLRQALLNPEQLKRIMASLPPAQRRQLSTLMAQLSAAGTNVATPALANAARAHEDQP